MFKYIHKYPKSTEHQINTDLKMDQIHVCEFYPLLNSIILYADDCSCCNNGQKYNERNTLDQAINNAIFVYTKIIYSEIKKTNKFRN